MGLILNKSVSKFIKGFPTVSDKYNVAGGILESGTAEFGQLLMLGSQPGYFKPAASLTAATQLGGIVLGTNVKVPTNYPGTEVNVVAGEAFNLLVDGFIAIELASTAKISEVSANAAVYFTADGKFTTASDSAKVAAIPNTVFTGEFENVGTADAVKYLVEIYVK